MVEDVAIVGAWVTSCRGARQAPGRHNHPLQRFDILETHRGQRQDQAKSNERRRVFRTKGALLPDVVSR